jgi:hypothetical protein
MSATEYQRRWRRRKRLGLVGRRPEQPASKGDQGRQALTEELARVTRERDEARRELAHRGVVPTAPPRGDFDDIRRTYIQALLRLPMKERAREMQVLGEALTADEAGADRRHAVADLDADFDDADLDLDEDPIDD